MIIVQFSHAGLLLVVRRVDPGGRVVIGRATVLHHTVEVGVKLVVLLLGDRVVFVIMAARAAQREAEKNGRGRVHAVDDVFDRVLFRHKAVFGILPMVAVEGRR